MQDEDGRDDRGGAAGGGPRRPTTATSIDSAHRARTKNSFQMTAPAADGRSRAGELEQAEVDAVIAGAQPLEGVQPREAAVDDPPDLAQP